MHISTIYTILLGLTITLVVFVGVLVILRFAIKLKWLTAACIAVIFTTLFFIGFGPPLAKWIILLPGAICVLILIIQFFWWLVSVSVESEVNSQERDRILKMVEEGKISTVESSELLDALGRSTAMRGEEKFSRQDFVILLGSALVVLGFFLPWTYLGNRMYQVGSQVGAVGWAVLIVGIFAVVPVFLTPKNLLYKMSMLQMFLTIVGLALIVSVFFRIGGNFGPGLVICLIGFAVELIACFGKFKQLST